MNEMSEPKRYEIQTLADMAKIPKGRIDAFLADLRICLLGGQAAGDVADAFAKNVSPDLGLSCRLESITWTDDGTANLNSLWVEGKNLLPQGIPESRTEEVVGGLHRMADRMRVLAEPGTRQEAGEQAFVQTPKGVCEAAKSGVCAVCGRRTRYRSHQLGADGKVRCQPCRRKLDRGGGLG